MNGIETNNRLRCLRRNLRGWISLNQKLGRRWMKYAKDVPWWYNERALLSLFVGAAWQNGEEAFEEYSEFKRGKKKHYSGRIDLWFSSGNHEFWAEAKHREVPITKSSKQRETIVRVLKIAVADVGRCRPDGETRRLAFVFVVPYLRKRPENIVRERLEWLLDLARATNRDALAWVFPKLKSLPEANGWISPGIVLLIKEVRRTRT